MAGLGWSCTLMENRPAVLGLFYSSFLLGGSHGREL